MTTETITNPVRFDAIAVRIAIGNEPLSRFTISELIHAARYEGEGWKQARRSEIVAYLRPLLVCR